MRNDKYKKEYKSAKRVYDISIECRDSNARFKRGFVSAYNREDAKKRVMSIFSKHIIRVVDARRATERSIGFVLDFYIEN